MEISVKNTGTGIIAFQHLGTVISLGPGESFKSNLDFTVPEKQVIAIQPELVYSNSEEQPVKEEVKTKPEPKKAQPEVAPEEEGDDLPEEEEVVEIEEEEQAPEEESKEEPKSKKKGNKK
jgi:hypothetical protein